MDRLIAGLKQFRTHTYPQYKQQFEALADVQHPRVLLITCSDSRVVPNLVTSADPGELFIIRNAGNLVPPYDGGAGGEAASLEYAVAALGVEHIVVCGHSGCGAMTALLDPSLAANMPSVQKWLELAAATRAAVDASTLADADRLSRAIEINTLCQLNNLRTHPSVAASLARGNVQLHAWVYNIGSGAVTAYDEANERFVELNETLHPVRNHLAIAS